MYCLSNKKAANYLFVHLIYSYLIITLTITSILSTRRTQNSPQSTCTLPTPGPPLRHPSQILIPPCRVQSRRLPQSGHGGVFETIRWTRSTITVAIIESPRDHFAGPRERGSGRGEERVRTACRDSPRCIILRYTEAALPRYFEPQQPRYRPLGRRVSLCGMKHDRATTIVSPRDA